MSNINKNITVEAKLISPPTYNYVPSKHNFIHKGRNSYMFQLAINSHYQAEHEENEKEDLQLQLMVEISNLQR